MALPYNISAALERLFGPVDGRTRTSVAGIRNNTAIQGLNAAGTANVDVIKLNASDIVEIPAANGLAVGGAVTITGAQTFTGAAAFASTVAVTGATTLSGAVTKKANVISGSGATVTLTAAQSGSVVLFDRAAGITYTLPAPAAGLHFDFHVTTTASGGSYKVITNAGTVLLIGSLINIDTDSSNAVAAWTANGSTHIAITMNGGTTGGVVGTAFRLTCLTATQWMVSGIDQGTGVVATPFATS